MSKFLNELSAFVGISESYVDKMNVKHYTTDNTKMAFLSSLGYDCSSASNIKRELKTELENLWLNGLDYTTSFFSSESIKVSLYLPENQINFPATFCFYCDNKLVEGFTTTPSKYTIRETKTINRKRFVKFIIPIRVKLSPDYYTLNVKVNDLSFSSFVIVAPDSAYLPPVIKEGKKVLGLSCQLYGLQSKHNLGIGDFGDLKRLIELSAKYGCDLIGVNPLGAMYSQSTDDVSPYRTLSRKYLNYAYLDLQSIPDFVASKRVQTFINTDKIKRTILKLKSSKFVDYRGVFKLKLAILKLMYEHFMANHIKKNTGAGARFARFKETEGAGLMNLCIFEAILDHQPKYWKNWDGNLSDISSDEVHNFIKKHKREIDFYAYTHWLCHDQLIGLSKLAKRKMKLGLYIDIPVGAASDGAEVWQDKALFADGVDIGTPPDTIRPRGQTWGLNPPPPPGLKKSHYAVFVDLLKKNMQYAGAIRIDHSFSLMRLFWVSQNDGGAYVDYDFHDMTAIVCLESYKNKCLVVGEDLGNIPPGFAGVMKRHNIFSNKVLYRSKPRGNNFLSDSLYPYHSLCQVGTHDQATSCGFWIGEDIRVNNECHLYPKNSQYIDNLKKREGERRDFFEIFMKTNSFYKHNEKSFLCNMDGKLPPKYGEYPFNIYGSKTPSAIFLCNLVDVYGMTEMQNAPGTVDEYPNWRVKLPVPVDDMVHQGDLKNFLHTLKRYR